MNIGLIGLGNIGSILAENLLQSDRKLVVHDLDHNRAEPLLALGAAWAATPREVAEMSQRVVTSLPSPEAVRAVMTGEDGVLAGLSEGAVWIETSTTDDAQLKELAAEAARRGAETLEATLSLGIHKMKARAGTIFAGGKEAVFQANEALMREMGGRVIYMGALGNATIIKLITNAITFVNLIGAAEGMMLAAKAGLDLGKAHQAIGASYGASYVNETEMKLVLNGSYDDSFTIDLCCKDLRLNEALCQRYGITQEVTGQVAAIFESARQKHGDRAFCAEAVRYVEEKAGLSLRAPGFPSSLLELD